MKKAPSFRFHRVRSGFTLLELMTVMVILAILAVLLIPVMKAVTDRAKRAACTTNLKSLQLAAQSYMLQNKHWPQIDPTLISRDAPGYAEAWHEAFKPFGIGRKNWICPTVQASLGNPDYETSRDNWRIDYLATPFDDLAQTPYRWATQPWFIEKADSHGSGNLMIFRGGEVKDLSEVSK